jgi:hypothetical protein
MSQSIRQDSHSFIVINGVVVRPSVPPAPLSAVRACSTPTVILPVHPTPDVNVPIIAAPAPPRYLLFLSTRTFYSKGIVSLLFLEIFKLFPRVMVDLFPADDTFFLLFLYNPLLFLYIFVRYFPFYFCFSFFSRRRHVRNSSTITAPVPGPSSASSRMPISCARCAWYRSICDRYTDIINRDQDRERRIRGVICRLPGYDTSRTLGENVFSFREEYNRMRSLLGRRSRSVNYRYRSRSV